MKTIEVFYVARYYSGEIEGVVAGPFPFYGRAETDASTRSFDESDNLTDYGVISTVMTYED